MSQSPRLHRPPKMRHQLQQKVSRPIRVKRVQSHTRCLLNVQKTFKFLLLQFLVYTSVCAVIRIVPHMIDKMTGRLAIMFFLLLLQPSVAVSNVPCQDSPRMARAEPPSSVVYSVARGYLLSAPACTECKSIALRREVNHIERLTSPRMTAHACAVLAESCGPHLLIVKASYRVSVTM